MSTTAGRRPKRRFRAPLSLVTAQVSDMAVSVYALVAQLDRGPKGCFATVRYLAERLGVERETAARALAELGQWVNRDQEDGHLRCRPVALHDGWVWLPNDVAEQMCARQWRLYAWVRYCGEVGRPVTPSEVAARVLTRKDGKAVSARTAKRYLLQLEEAGWVRVTEQPGKASLYEALEQPIPAGVAAQRAAERRATPHNQVTAPPTTRSHTPGNEVTSTPDNGVTGTPPNGVTQSSVNRSGGMEQEVMAEAVRNGAVVEGYGADGSRRRRGGAGSADASPSPRRWLNGGPGVQPPVAEVLRPRCEMSEATRAKLAGLRAEWAKAAAQKAARAPGDGALAGKVRSA